MANTNKKELIRYLKNFVTENRWKTIERVLDQRTRQVCVVLEDIYQPHNASAVLRSCDCFGVQDIHVIENRHEFSPSSSVTIGADQWVTLHSYNRTGVNNTARCFEKLRQEGYAIIATTPHEQDVTLPEIPVNRKTALLFGAELTGLSDYALDHADGFVRIPMFGFSESYNISVSAALCLYELTLRIRDENIDWQLSENEKTELRIEWLKKSIRAGDELEQKFLSE